MKESLCILIKYNLVTYKPNRNSNVANYELVNENVLLMLRYPKYIHMIKIAFGHEAEIMLEEILQRGYMTASDVIIKVSSKLEAEGKPVSLPVLRDHFNAMVVAKYLRRVPKCNEEKPEPILNEKETFSLPTIDIPQLASALKGNSEVHPDAGIYWTINFDRFHQDMRDKIVVDAVARKFDDNLAELMRVLLQRMYIRTEPWVDFSNPIPIIEVRDLIKKLNTHPELITYFDAYVSILGNNFIKIKFNV